MDGIERLLEDFNRIKVACQEMEQKKIRVGIVGGKAEDSGHRPDCQDRP